MDLRRLAAAQHQLMFSNISSMGHVKAKIDVDFIRMLPRFDVTIFLSVLHHMIYKEGVDCGIRVLRAIHEITDKVLVLDMGQPGERVDAWRDIFPDSKEGFCETVDTLVRSAGFASAVPIGEGDSYKEDDASRILFKVLPCGGV